MVNQYVDHLWFGHGYRPDVTLLPLPGPA